MWGEILLSSTKHWSSSSGGYFLSDYIFNIVYLNVTPDFCVFEIVDIFKKYDNIIIMKFTVEKLPQAKNEIDSLEQSQKDMLEADYKKIQE